MEKDYIIVDANRQVAPDVTHKTEALLFNVNQLFKKKKKFYSAMCWHTSQCKNHDSPQIYKSNRNYIEIHMHGF